MAPGRFSLQDRGYIAGIHPLELWLVAYLQDHPNAPRNEVVEASAGVRQDVYGWLFKSRNMHRQNTRIRMLLHVGRPSPTRSEGSGQRQENPSGDFLRRTAAAPIGSSVTRRMPSSF